MLSTFAGDCSEKCIVYALVAFDLSGYLKNKDITRA